MGNIAKKAGAGAAQQQITARKWVILIARKGKFEDWIDIKTNNLFEEKRVLIESWARDGLSNEEISQKMGISRETLHQWCKRYPDIADTLKKGKEIPDAEVENALFKKAIGYNVKVQKTFKIRTVEFDEVTGKKVREYEELKTGYDEVHVAADTTAQIYWLKNRLPKKWRDKINLELGNDKKEEFEVKITVEDGNHGKQ